MQLRCLRLLLLGPDNVDKANSISDIIRDLELYIPTFPILEPTSTIEQPPFTELSHLLNLAEGDVVGNSRHTILMVFVSTFHDIVRL